MRRAIILFLVTLFTITGQYCYASDVEDNKDNDDDKNEVDRILSATNIIKEIRTQREKHAVQLIEIEMTMETEMKLFYKKQDAALSRLRTIDSELRQRVNNLESKVIAEAQVLADRAPGYSSWWVPFFALLAVIIGVYAYVNRAITKSVSSKYL
jgi:uncharacterized membrane protein